MQLVKFDPMKNIATIGKEMDKMLKEGWNWFPEVSDYTSMDMYKDGDNLVVELVLPHFKKDEVKVTFDQMGLEILAEHKEEKKPRKNSKRHYLLQEINQSYWRRISLPAGADGENGQVTFEKGLLTVKVPLKPIKEAVELTVT